MEEKYLSKYHRKNPIRDIDPEQTLYDLIFSINCGNMDSPYSYYLGKEKSFAELKNETDRFAAALYADGVRKGDIVAACLLTVPEVAPTLLALNKIGAVSYWLDATLNPEGLLHYINENHITHMVAFEPLAEAILPIIDYTGLKRVVLVKADASLGMPDVIHNLSDTRFSEYSDYIVTAIDKTIPKAEYCKTRPSLIAMSSGSTGAAKSIVHTDFNINNALLRMAYSDIPFSLGADNGYVCAPPWVIYGLINSICSSLVFGSKTVYSTIPDEAMLLKDLGTYDFAYAVPVYLRYLYNYLSALKKDSKEYKRVTDELKKVNVFISGGDKIPENELIQWQIALNTPILNGYGNNEVTGAAIVSPMFANHPGSIGVAMYGNTLRTANPDTGEILPEGQEGELVISSDSLFAEYLNNPEDTAKIKRFHDGKWWVHTGDLAKIDENGYVFLLGRSRRLIIDKLGYKISPENSENLIQSLGCVDECVVVGVEVGENDYVPAAFVEFKEADVSGKLMEQVRTICKNNLKGYEQPKFFFSIDKIPHKSNGGKRDFLALERLAKEMINHSGKNGNYDE